LKKPPNLKLIKENKKALIISDRGFLQYDVQHWYVIAGPDIGAISSKSLISFSYQGDGIRQQNVPSAINKNQLWYQRDGTQNILLSQILLRCA
jgi:hypothetical protein